MLKVKGYLTCEISKIIDEMPNEFDLESILEQIEDYGKYQGMLVANSKDDWNNYVPVKGVKEIIKKGGMM